MTVEAPVKQGTARRLMIWPEMDRGLDRPLAHAPWEVPPVVEVLMHARLVGRARVA